MSGVESTGFVTRTLDEIVDELITNLRAELGAELELTVNSPEGQLVRVVAAALAELWGQGQAVYDSGDPASAVDAALDNLSSLSGTVRRKATKSTVTATLNVDAGRTVDAGSIVSVSGNPSARFVLLADVVNAGGVAADIDGLFEAEVTGPIVANAGTLTVIETPVTGWNSVTNAADAAVGTDIETNESLRQRRETELQAVGSSTLASLLADVRQTLGVTEAIGFDNDTNETSPQGLPPRSFEVIAVGGTDTDVATTIVSGKPAGIQAFGSTVVQVTDAEGNSHGIGLTRPAVTTLHCEVTLLTDSDYPVDGDAQVREAIRSTIDSLGISQDVILASLFGSILAISGVVDVTAILLDTVDPPVGTSNIAIGDREIADIETPNIDVVTS